MADETQRVYALVRSNEQELLDRWVDVAAASLQGRLTRQRARAGLRRSVGGAHARAGRGRAEHPVRGLRVRARAAGRDVPRPRPPRLQPERDRLRGLRPQGSPVRHRRRARRHVGDDRRPCRAGSTPRPVHLRDVRQGPRADHHRAGRAAAGADHAGGQAVGRRPRRAAGRHAGLGAHPGGDGEAAAGAGRHRLRARHHRHHRGARGRHPGRPAPAQDRGGGAADGRGVHHLRHPPADRADHRGAGHRVRRHRRPRPRSPTRCATRCAAAASRSCAARRRARA